MKKKLLSVFMAAVMMFGMNSISHADEAKYYAGTVEVEVYSGDDISETIPVTGTLKDGIVSGEFTTTNGHSFKWTYDVVGEVTQVVIDGTYEENYGGGRLSEDGQKFEIGMKNETAESPIYFWFNAILECTDAPVIPEAYQVSEGFLGSATSDRGEYDIYLAGYFEKELVDGTYTLSAADIAAQTISIVAYHKADGVKRVMTQSTVEAMTVTVSNGSVSEYIISGRVQTSGGALDRYTVTIN